MLEELLIKTPLTLVSKHFRAIVGYSYNPIKYIVNDKSNIQSTEAPTNQFNSTYSKNQKQNYLTPRPFQKKNNISHTINDTSFYKWENLIPQNCWRTSTCHNWNEKYCCRIRQYTECSAKTCPSEIVIGTLHLFT